MKKLTRDETVHGECYYRASEVDAQPPLLVQPAHSTFDTHAAPGKALNTHSRLPQPAQEPVAFLDWYENAIWGNEDFQDGCHRAWDAALEHTTPPQPAQEPVAWMVYTQDGQSVYVTDNPNDIQEGQRALPLYTTPPQRPWVGLTEEDFSAINQSCLTKLQAATSAESIFKRKNI